MLRTHLSKQVFSLWFYVTLVLEEVMIVIWADYRDFNAYFMKTNTWFPSISGNKALHLYWKINEMRYTDECWYIPVVYVNVHECICVFVLMCAVKHLLMRQYQATVVYIVVPYDPGKYEWMNVYIKCKHFHLHHHHAIWNKIQTLKVQKLHCKAKTIV